GFFDDPFLAPDLALVVLCGKGAVVAHGLSVWVVDCLAAISFWVVPTGEGRGAYACNARAAAAHIGEAAKDLVPEPLDLARILARQLVAESAEDGAKRPVGDPRRRGDLAPSADALVRRHLYEQELTPVGRGGLDQPRPDARDLHGFFCLPVLRMVLPAPQRLRRGHPLHLLCPHLFDDVPARSRHMARNRLRRPVGVLRLYALNELSVVAQDGRAAGEGVVHPPGDGAQHLAVLPPQLSGVAVVVALVHHRMEGGVELAV